MAALLAAEKAHIVELQRVIGEKDSMEERLLTATHRYMSAEKKLDKAKSKSVQEMEQQAIMKREEDTAGVKDKVKKESSTDANGELDADTSAAIDLARREAVAAAETVSYTHLTLPTKRIV